LSSTNAISQGWPWGWQGFTVPLDRRAREWGVGDAVAGAGGIPRVGHRRLACAKPAVEMAAQTVIIGAVFQNAWGEMRTLRRGRFQGEEPGTAIRVAHGQTHPAHMKHFALLTQNSTDLPLGTKITHQPAQSACVAWMAAM